MGIGIISDHDDQPLIISSHLGTFAIVTVCKINNIAELTQKALGKKIHFSKMGSGETNPTELVAMLICEEGSF
jgi:amidophosphoribosyltransferase